MLQVEPKIFMNDCMQEKITNTVLDAYSNNIDLKMLKSSITK